MCTALNIYCILCTLSDSYLPLIIDFRLHREADPAALHCVLQPLLLWKYFPPATMQQSLVFVWTGFEGPGEKKSPHSAMQGWAWGWGRAAMASLPHCCGASPTPIPNRGFLCWLVGSLGHRAGLISASLDTYNLGIFVIWSLGASFITPGCQLPHAEVAEQSINRWAELLSRLSQR